MHSLPAGTVTFLFTDIEGSTTLLQRLGDRAFAHRSDYDRPVATIRDGLKEEAFAAAWAEGRAMTLEQAIEYALASGRPSGTV
jgi:hypothetical protein